MAEKEMNLKRYQVGIFATMFVGCACYAYNRKSLSFCIHEVIVQEGLDKSHAGLIISSQHVAFAVSQFLAGVLSDRISSRLLFCSGLVGSGIATVLFGLVASSVPAYAALWFFNGLGQGCAWPACVKLLQRWYSPAKFGRCWSVLSASANVSGGVSPFISAYLVLNYGWRTSLIVAGVVSSAMGLIALFILVNCPEDVGLQGFRTHTANERKSDETEESATLSDLLRSPIIWLASFCYMTVFCGKTSAVDWGQLYLIEDRNRTQYVGSAFTSSVETGGFFGRIAAGYTTDWAVSSTTKDGTSSTEGSPRLAIAVYFLAGAMFCLHLLRFYILETTSQLWITLLGFLLGACLYGSIAIFGIVSSECAPLHLSGTSQAIGSLAGRVGAVMSGLPFSYIAKYYSWATVFLVLELVTGFTVLLMLCCRNFSSQITKQEHL